MRIGRFSFGINRDSYWGYLVGACDCFILDLGKLYIVLNNKECYCTACNEYDCVCEEE